ncbi:MAG: hypothetical protein NT065_01865 [Chlamydiae bacterium]|nr:hypothetical protein [Chlamydiota bacterium]
MQKTHNRLTDDELWQIFYLKNTEKFRSPRSNFFKRYLDPRCCGTINKQLIAKIKKTNSSKLQELTLIPKIGSPNGGVSGHICKEIFCKATIPPVIALKREIA